MTHWKYRTALGFMALSAPCLVIAKQPAAPIWAASTDKIVIAAKGDDIPLSRDALFDLEPVKKAKPTASGKAAAKSEPTSKDELFADLPAEPKAEQPVPASKDALFADLPAEPKAEQPVPASKDALFADLPAEPKAEQPVPASKDALFADLPAEPKAEQPVPASKDALFADLPTEPKAEQPVPASKDALFADLPAEPKAEQPAPASKDALFADLPAEPGKESAPIETHAAKAPSGWHGFFQGEAAHTYADPDHWSKLTGRLELGTRGKLDNGMQWKASGRVDYNAVFDTDDFYASAVRKDQRAEFSLRETYLDVSSGDWEYRLGRQHIIWGEMVGLFFADVVSAKDLREFVLQDFQLMRIPQWAARAEYFKDDFHAELIWIPFPSFDEIGKPGTLTNSGSEFYAYPASPGIPNVTNVAKPGNSFSNTNYGVRLSNLSNGWDLSGFIYSSMDTSPTYYLTSNAFGVYNYEGRYERIHHVGGTLAKDMGDFVLKAEAIYTGGRRYTVTVDDAINYPDGVVKQNTLDWVVGLDFNPGVDTRINTQFFQRIYFDHDKNIVPDRLENGISLLVNHKLGDKLEAEALLVRSLNRNDWMFRPKLTWGFERNWKLALGVDVFGGPDTGIFGQFDDKDRVYTEVRYDF